MKNTEYTWSDFNNLPFDIREGVLAFWEPHFDYSDPDFWASYDPTPDPAFVKAVQLYDWLQTNCPEEE